MIDFTVEVNVNKDIYRGIISYLGTSYKRIYLVTKTRYSYRVRLVKSEIKFPSPNDILIPVHRQLWCPRSIGIRKVDVHYSESFSARNVTRLYIIKF